MGGGTSDSLPRNTIPWFPQPTFLVKIACCDAVISICPVGGWIKSNMDEDDRWYRVLGYAALLAWESESAGAVVPAAPSHQPLCRSAAI